MGKVKAIPDGYHTVTPYLGIDGNCAEMIEFYKKALGAEERMRMPMPGGKIAHAEIKIGNSIVMLSDLMPDQQKSSVMNCLYVEDCDALFKRAVAAGAKEVRPLTNQFYGDRSGTVSDPAGHKWTISTHIEDVSDAEMAERMKKMPM